MSAPGIGSNVLITPPGGWPLSLASGATWVSQPFALPGAGITVAARCSGTATLTVQRYLDQALTLAVGAAGTASLTANTPGSATLNDGTAALYAVVLLANTAGATNTVAAMLAAANLQGS